MKRFESTNAVYKFPVIVVIIIVFTHMPGESYWRRLRSVLSLCLRHVSAGLIDDLRKSRGLHSVSAYRQGPVYLYRSMPAGVAQSRHAFVGGTVSTWGR